MEKTFLAGWLIDGTGAPVRKNTLVGIRDGIFEEIMPFGQRGDEAGTFLDLSGCTLLPALADVHVHLAMSGTVDEIKRQEQLTAGFESIRKTISQNLKQWLLHGVLALRDGGDRGGFTARYKSECMDEQDAAISLQVAGKAWHKPGRYGSFVGRALKRAKLAEGILAESGPMDTVKILQSGLNSVNHFGKESLPQFQWNELKKAVAAAALLGLKTMVHANGRLPVEIALTSGCHSIEHGYFMGEENLARMADTGAFWVPTAAPMKALCMLPSLGEERRGVAFKTLEHQLGQMSLARRLGVNMAVGTDAGSVGVLHGSAIIDEIALFKEAGFSIEGAIQCAASNGARLLGLDERGTIKKGLAADFVVVKGRPAELPESLSKISMIHLGDRFL